MKVVINACYGGFSVSRAALHRLRELGDEHALKEVDFGERWDKNDAPDSSGAKVDEGVNTHNFNAYGRDIPRDSPLLIRVLEELGAEANGECARLKVVDIPDGIEWEVDEYDGYEKVVEKHRSWA